MSSPQPLFSAEIEIDHLFHSPKPRLAAFARMQMLLYRHDVTLQDYFLPLQMGTLMSPQASTRDEYDANPLAEWAIHTADKASRILPRQKIKTDVLFCPAPYFNRQTENRFLIRALLGLAQTGARILCLMPADAACRAELDTQLAAAGRDGNVVFLDPTESLNPVEGRLRWKLARMRGRLAFAEIVRVLEPHGLSPSREVAADFEHTAYFIECWERLAPTVEFEAVVNRCHWHTLCSPVSRTALERGKPVVTFQQGVIGHTLDVPVTASKYVAFGQPSASFLAKVNRKFFEAAGMPEPPVEYVNAGSLFDTLTTLPDQFDRQTLLMVDCPTDPGDFYGVESQCQALIQLAERLLKADLPLQRLVIRPHPYWSTLEFDACKNLARQHPSRCELSHPVWSLEDDLRRSSAVIGISSGVLTVASSCGLPTIFLRTEQGFSTGDLECFSHGQTFLPDAAFCEIGKILTDREAYAESRTHALRNAHQYYANGGGLDINATFFHNLFRDEPVGNRMRLNQGQ